AQRASAGSRRDVSRRARREGPQRANVRPRPPRRHRAREVTILQFERSFGQLIVFGSFPPTRQMQSLLSALAYTSPKRHVCQRGSDKRSQLVGSDLLIAAISAYTSTSAETL